MIPAHFENDENVTVAKFEQAEQFNNSRQVDCKKTSLQDFVGKGM